MNIHPSRIPPHGRAFAGEDPAAILDLGDETLVRPAAPVTYDLLVRFVSGRLIVTGKVSTTVECHCSRCGVLFTVPVEEPRFERDMEVHDIHQSVDLTPDLREATILRFPAYPVCQETCRGLCGQCGADLNMTACDCTPPDDDMRWGTLDGLEVN